MSTRVEPCYQLVIVYVVFKFLLTVGLPSAVVIFLM